MALGLARRAALLMLAGLPLACTSPNPTLYVLAPVPGAVHSGGPRNIAVRAISLARYLERSQIVRSSEDYRLEVLPNEWWGEPLDSLINRVLVQELTQRMAGSMVYGDNGAISVAPDATVEINVERFDLDRAGAVLLLGQVAVSGEITRSRGVSITVTPADPSTAAQVAAMSRAIGQLGDAVAAMLAAGGGPRQPKAPTPHRR